MNSRAILKQETKLSEGILYVAKNDTIPVKNDIAGMHKRYSHNFREINVHNPVDNPPAIQTKLQVNQPGDRYEQEADAMADRVMRMPAPPINFSNAPNNIQRKCAHCEEEDKEKKIQRKESGGQSASFAPPIVNDVLNSSSGKPMDNITRSFMESRFNYDFSNVKIHNDSTAAKSAGSVNALAYTYGNDIVFNSGQYDPENSSGKKLLAHELTHVIQQNNNINQNNINCKKIPGSDEEDNPNSLKQVSPAQINDDNLGDDKRLPGSVLSAMEKQLGANYSHVRIHDDPLSGNYALSLGARAVTKGSEIYFAPGHYRPDTNVGMGLLAHELTHVTQQGNGRFPTTNSNKSLQTRYDLEKEAEGAEHGFINSVSPLVKTNEKVNKSQVQASLFDELSEFRDIINGGLESAANYVLERYSSASSTIAQLGQLRNEMRGLTSIQVPLEIALGLQAMYDGLRGEAPGWLRSRIPDVSFDGPRVQTAAFLITIPIAAILMLMIILILLWWLVTDSIPEIHRSRERAIENLIRWLRGAERRGSPPVPPPTTGQRRRTEEDTETRPEQDRRPDTRPRPPRPVPLSCMFPTGLTALDPIPMIWYKPDTPDYYPQSINLGGITYDHNEPTTLPHGEPIGVAHSFWPSLSKPPFQLFPEARGRNADRFRAVLRRYGYDWTGLQADHVQDLQWEGVDEFRNLWPMDSRANMSAGTRQNNSQRVSFCETENGPPRINVSIQQMKDENKYFRFFKIAGIQR